MATPKTDGGPAFPTVVRIVGEDWSDGAFGGFRTTSEGGLSVRDWLAGNAPPMPEGWALDEIERDEEMARPDETFERRGLLELTVDWSYAYADAMLAKRRQEQESSHA